MNQHYTYFLILAASLAGPVILSFDKKVAFFRQWKYLFPAMILPALIYIAWDLWFTALGVWGFNPLYVTGIYLINLPIEEVLFFLVVPYCCMFIYACIKAYFPNIKQRTIYRFLLWFIAVAGLVVGIINLQRYYTSVTFFALSIFLFIILASKKIQFISLAHVVVSYLVILIPFLLVNGFLTAIPVVIYNNDQNLGIRLTTIPVEDIYYGFLLFLLNVTCFEFLQKRFSSLS